jgi:nicotinamidase-related amidase
MMRMEAKQSVLVLIDLQKKLMPAIHAGNEVVAQCVRLAEIATLLEVPVIGTEQNPAGLGQNVEEVRQLCEWTVSKTHFDACADGLPDALPRGRRSMVVAGCEAHVCLLQTALGLLQNKYEVWVVRDAVGSRRQSDRDAALERLREAGAHLVTTEMVAFEWLRHSGHPDFRAVLDLIK